MPVSPVVHRELYLGLDIGQVRDPAALCVLERRREFNPAPHRPEHFQSRWLVSYGVRHLERMKLGTPYPAVVDRVAAVCVKLVESGNSVAELVVDVTGVGRPVYELLRDRGLRCRVIGLNYTSGDSVTSGPGGIFNVPKRDLVAQLVVLFQNAELRISEKLSDASVLVAELVNFQQKLSEAGAQSFGNDGKVAKHDDYVNAAALAAWRAVLRTPKELGQKQRLAGI